MLFFVKNLTHNLPYARMYMCMNMKGQTASSAGTNEHFSYSKILLLKQTNVYGLFYLVCSFNNGK